jgi:hypothetical protein
MLYVPSAAGTRPLPLFVMLHGCLQVKLIKEIHDNNDNKIVTK